MKREEAQTRPCGPGPEQEGEGEEQAEGVKEARAEEFGGVAGLGGAQRGGSVGASRLLGALSGQWRPRAARRGSKEGRLEVAGEEVERGLSPVSLLRTRESRAVKGGVPAPLPAPASAR